MPSRVGKKIEMTSLDELLCVPSVEGARDIEIKFILQFKDHARVWNPNTNYTEINKTDYSYTESNHILSAVEKSDGIGCDEDERAYREVIAETIHNTIPR